MSKNNVIIFDTTLRDGEQVPGCQLNTVEKLEVAKALEVLGVDVIEAGFPISSPEDLKAVQEISRVIRRSSVCALARALDKDIDAAYEAIKKAKAPRIHTFVSTSDIHLKYQIKKSRAEILKMTEVAVKRAKKYVSDVEFSAMDATRSDPIYLIEVFRVAVKAGATTLNIPDTVGYSLPQDFGKLVEQVREGVPEAREGKVVLSVHCHNDLGLATANALAGVSAGARQVEGTINGLGERAGNTAIEEVVMALKANRDTKLSTGVKTKKIYPTSRLISQLMRMPVQANKAIVGRNAFAHSSGIHQHGILNKRENFEIINPQDVGVPQTSLVLTARSGRAALRHRLSVLGHKLSAKKLDEFYEKFLKLADKKREVNDSDLQLLLTGVESAVGVKLEKLEVVCGQSLTPLALVELMTNGESKSASAYGNGPIDAAYKAIDKIVRRKVKLEEYLVQAITGGSDDLGKVHVQISYRKKPYYGFGADTDIITASVKAYLDALNKII